MTTMNEASLQAVPAPIAIDGAPVIDGLVFRAFDPAHDVPAVTRVVQAQLIEDRSHWVPSEASLRNEYEHTAGFTPADDAIVADAAGRIVATGAVIQTVRDGQLEYMLDAAVDPSWRRRGLGSSILRWQEARARERLGNEPVRDGAHLTSWVEDSQTGSLALLAGAGYRQVRFGFMMTRDLDDPIPEIALPEGIEVRPVEEAHHRAIFEAENEAFRDHWNHREQEEVDFVRTFAAPDLDTSLWRVAWDGDEIAAVVQNFIFPEENDRLGVKRGWLEHISTRRPWRRRGLATALTISSLHAFRERGLTEAALGVDSENPNGALGLYEDLGFRKLQTGIAHRKEL